MDTKLLGCYGNSNDRVKLGVRLIQDLHFFWGSFRAWARDSGLEDAGQLFNFQPSSATVEVKVLFAQVVTKFKLLLERTVLSTTYLWLSFCNAAITTFHMNHDKSIISNCLSVSDKLFAFVIEYVKDSIILQTALQQYVDLMSLMMPFLSSEDPTLDVDGSESSAGDDAWGHSAANRMAARVRAFQVGGEMVLETRKCFIKFPKDLRSPGSLVYYETALRAYVTIFVLSLGLGESDFLNKFGYTVPRLLASTVEVLENLHFWIARLGRSVLSVQTMLSLHMVQAFCNTHVER